MSRKGNSHLHWNGPRGNQLSRAALGDAGTVSTCLKKRKLIRRQTNHLDQPIFGRWLLGSAGSAPRMRSTAVRGDVQENNGVNTVFLQLGRHVLAVAVQRHEFREILPLSSHEILTTHLAVKHLVP